MFVYISGLVHGASQLLRQRNGKLHAKLILDISKYAFELRPRGGGGAGTGGEGGGATKDENEAASTAAAAAASDAGRKRKREYLIVKIRAEGMAGAAEKLIKITLPKQGTSEAQSDR